MEPLLIILVPGLLGGMLLAAVFYRFEGVSSRDAASVERLEPPSPGMINMAHIRVAGLGGLGMVAMSIVVAIFVPRIRLTMALGLVLGCAMAAILVALRRWNDDLPGGIEPGAHALFPLDGPQREATSDQRRADRVRRQRVQRAHAVLGTPACMSTSVTRRMLDSHAPIAIADTAI